MGCDDALEPVELADKYPREIIAYTLSAMRLSPFQRGIDTIAGATFTVFVDGDPAMTALPGMIGAVATFGAVDATSPLVGSGSDAEGTYILQAMLYCDSGRRYILRGRFRVTNAMGRPYVAPVPGPGPVVSDSGMIRKILTNVQVSGGTIFFDTVFPDTNYTAIPFVHTSDGSWVVSLGIVKARDRITFYPPENGVTIEVHIGYVT